MYGSYRVAAMAVIILFMSLGCTSKFDLSQPTLLDRIKALESMQEDSQKARQELEKKNFHLTERVNQLGMDLANLSLELERLQPSAVPSEVQAPVKSVLPDNEVTHHPVRQEPHKDMATPKKAQGKAKPAAKAKDVYATALHRLESRQPQAARKLLQAFIKQFPQTSLVPNALYWLGETHFDEDQFAQAILAFKKVPETYPRDPKAPDALFKIISCYLRLGDRQNATFYLGVLIREYPKSRASRLARDRFAALL